jgi:3-oxoacyl-[acyl-carrier-protein] synthase III
MLDRQHIAARSVGLLGLGHALPETKRTNADPIFKQARLGAVANGVSEAQLFTGVIERRVVQSGETAEALTVNAARAAIAAAGVDANKIDRVYGCVSPSTYLVPNGLFEVHRQLGLRSDALVLPITTEFTTFVLGCAMAKEAIASGACEHVLVASGGAWSQNMDYGNPHAWSIGDAACAAVLGPAQRFLWVDHAVVTHSDAVDSMTLRPRSVETEHGVSTKATYQIAPDGIRVFLELGMTEPPRLLNALMHKHGVAAEELTLVSHQASGRLMDSWAEQIRPAAYLSSLAELGNMTLATVGVNLSRERDKITTGYVGCIALGAGQHFAVSLIKC